MDEIPVNVIINKRINDKISDQMKKMIIRNMNSDMNGKQVAKLVDRKANTVRALYRRYLKTGLKTNKKRGKPKPVKLTEDQKQMIREWVDHNCTLTLKELRKKSIEEWPELGSISRPTVHNALKSFHYTFKRMSIVPEGRNTPEVIAQRYAYGVQYTQLKFENKKLIFIDEMGVQIWSRASGGRAPKGVRASKEVKRIRSRNYSVCAAMSSDALYFFEIQDCSYIRNTTCNSLVNYAIIWPPMRLPTRIW